MRLIHTADWQIGKVFKQFGDKEESLRQATLTAIESIGRLAVQKSAGHVLVAGDVFDNEVPTEVTLRAPLERIKLFPQVKWHFLPGNHDPHRPRGLWERLTRLGVPANVHLHLTLGSDAVLLPAPPTRKSETNDLTDWMDKTGKLTGSFVFLGPQKPISLQEISRVRVGRCWPASRCFRVHQRSRQTDHRILLD
jgi:DNA repair exonuclease SbcCD nuclease subunit